MDIKCNLVILVKQHLKNLFNKQLDKYAIYYPAILLSEQHWSSEELLESTAHNCKGELIFYFLTKSFCTYIINYVCDFLLNNFVFFPYTNFNILIHLIIFCDNANDQKINIFYNECQIINFKDYLIKDKICYRLYRASASIYVILRTEKYPQQDDYDNYLSQNGSLGNAWTFLDHTIYYLYNLYIIPKKLKGFRWPCQLSARLDHPYSKFGDGNRKSLDTIPKEKNINVRNRILEFYQKYSANIMSFIYIYCIRDGSVEIASQQRNFNQILKLLQFCVTQIKQLQIQLNILSLS
ncbi:hypothetical protein DBV15_05891 [Temnothorax longispinosus]|uniref:Uncharacterized protein n=1 Tax=Temnothorax longispinosus TaxID=300112 RepID=A0A4S2KIN8_9HYME|nr:hypothetical protein DBV15_05891 [Temnothorax longispinosus]